MLLFDDTKKLEKAIGEEATRAFLNILDASKNEAATKADLRETELRLTAEIEKIRSEIEKSKAETIKWVIGMLLAQSALIAGIVKLLVK